MAELAGKELPNVYNDDDAQTLERSIESLKEQIGLYEKSIQGIKDQERDYLEQCDVDDRAWAIRLAPGNHEKVDDKKVFKYEFDPAYWECVKEKMVFEYRDQVLRKEGTIKGFKHRVDELESQLQITKDKLADLEKLE